MSPSSRLAVVSRVGERDFSVRLSMLQQALRASRALWLSRGLQASLYKQARTIGNMNVSNVLPPGEQIMYWRGDRMKRKKRNCET